MTEMTMNERRLKGCDCDEWDKGVESLNGAISLAWAHGIEYTGSMFKYCPWCGKKREYETKVSYSVIIEVEND